MIGARGTNGSPGVASTDPEVTALRWDTASTVVTGVGLAAGVVASLVSPRGEAEWLAVAGFGLAYAAGGIPTGWEALRELRRGRLDIDLLMVLAAVAAALVGEPRDGAILLFLFRLAGTLEAYAMGRTKRAVQSLMTLRPDTALRRSDGASPTDDARTERVPIEQLRIGDIVVIKPGERLPVDGIVRRGSSAVDQAAITGESMPVDKSPGDAVFAATMNGHGALEVEVVKRSSESTVARMITLVTEAQAARSPNQRLGDWFGQRYTVFVLAGSAVALGGFLLSGMPMHQALYKAATLLVVASPCAVVISVPAATLSALAAAGRSGVLFKGGAALERFARSTILALDKTGTVTEGKPRVTSVWPNGIDEASLLRDASSLEARSEHPIAASVLREARGREVRFEPAADARALPGFGIEAAGNRGVLWAGNRRLAEQRTTLDVRAEAHLASLEANGETPVLVGRDGTLLGVIAVADGLRPGAGAALERLREAGIERFVMLSGDHDGAARAIGRQLGITAGDTHGGLLPEDKVAKIEELRTHGSVAFVGDGVNDAAALATADVGIAMGAAGSDVALETADVALLSDDLAALGRAYLLAQRAERIIRQNLAFALGVMGILVLFTLFGSLPLPLAVLGHEGGTILVVLNGLRLLLPHRSVRGRHDSHPGAPLARAGAAP